MPIHQPLNLTPFAAALRTCADRDGQDLAVAAVKATYRFTVRGEVAPAPPDAQLPVLDADQHWGDPARTSVRWASDVSPPKAGTDVAIIGHAYGRDRTEVEAGFGVGALAKTVVVSGPRVWVGAGGGIAGPVPFEKVPLRYEHAFGGGYEEGGRRVVWPANPAGVGFATEAVARAPLPCVELRAERFRSLRDRPTPAGLGFVPPGWTARARFGGTYDAAWQRSRRPLLPADLDERFWNTVPQDQVHRPKLAGGERLVLLRVHPEAETVTLALPRLALAAAFRVKDQETVVPMTLDTVLVEPDEGRLALTYRAILPLGDDLMKLRSVVFREKGRAAPPADAAARPPAR